MIRVLVVVLAMLVVVVGPAEARGTHGTHGHFQGGHGRVEGGHRHFDRSRHFDPFLFSEPYPYLFPAPYYYPPAPVCSWRDGYWIDQLYVDRYGGSTHVPEWIPGHWICS